MYCGFQDCVLILKTLLMGPEAVYLKFAENGFIRMLTMFTESHGFWKSNRTQVGRSQEITEETRVLHDNRNSFFSG